MKNGKDMKGKNCMTSQCNDKGKSDSQKHSQGSHDGMNRNKRTEDSSHSPKKGSEMSRYYDSGSLKKDSKSHTEMATPGMAKPDMAKSKHGSEKNQNHGYKKYESDDSESSRDMSKENKNRNEW